MTVRLLSDDWRLENYTEHWEFICYWLTQRLNESWNYLVSAAKPIGQALTTSSSMQLDIFVFLPLNVAACEPRHTKLWSLKILAPQCLQRHARRQSEKACGCVCQSLDTERCERSGAGGKRLLFTNKAMVFALAFVVILGGFQKAEHNELMLSGRMNVSVLYLMGQGDG